MMVLLFFKRAAPQPLHHPHRHNNDCNFQFNSLFNNFWLQITVQISKTLWASLMNMAKNWYSAFRSVNMQFISIRNRLRLSFPAKSEPTWPHILWFTRFEPFTYSSRCHKFQYYERHDCALMLSCLFIFFHWYISCQVCSAVVNNDISGENCAFVIHFSIWKRYAFLFH